MTTDVILHYSRVSPQPDSWDVTQLFKDLAPNYFPSRVAWPRVLALWLLRRAFVHAGQSFEFSSLKRLPNGQAVVAGEWSFSISHSEHWVAVALSRLPVGVDVERAARVLEKHLRFLNIQNLGAALTPAEQWVTLEAVAKLRGDGILKCRGLVMRGPEAQLAEHRIAIERLAIDDHWVAIASPKLGFTVKKIEHAHLP